MTQLAVAPLAYGLVAALSWGLADFFAANASKKNSPEIATLWVALIGAIVFTPIYFLSPGSIPWASIGIGYAIAAGLFLGYGLLMFYRALDAGPVSIVSPIGSAYPLITTLMVLLFLGGSLTFLQIVGILLVTFGIVVASGLLDAKKSERKITTGIAFALVTFVAWGVAFALLGEAVSMIGWQKATLVDMWFELLAIFIAISLMKNKIKISKSSYRLLGNKFVLATALIQLIGIIAFDIGLTKTDSSAVLTAISATYPALTVFLALKHFKEKVVLIPLLGSFVTVVGIVLLSIE